MESLPEILQHCPRLHFILAGDEGEDKVRAKAEAMGVIEAIELPGWVNGDQKNALLAKADIFVLPSYFEGLPVGLLEAMAFGLQIVTTRWRAIPELLPADYLGFVPAKSPEAVATALQAAMFQDARTLRDAFLNHFTIERHVEMLGKALKTMDSL